MHVKFDEFEPVMSPITVPMGCMFMRGYDARYPFPSDRPTYLTHSLMVAKGYAAFPMHQLGHVVTTRDLRVLDLRYVCAILRLMFAKRSRVDAESSDAIRTTTLAYGLSSMGAQVSLFRDRFRGEMDASAPGMHANADSLRTCLRAMDSYLVSAGVEVPGIRIAETYNDAEALLVLKNLLTGVDGYIAPLTPSPFHVTWHGLVPAELVIFDPVAAGLRLMSADEVIQLTRRPHDVRSLELVTLPGARADMMPVNDATHLGFDRVWMKGGAKTPRARQGAADPFDPCGIDRIPKATYKNMCTRAKRAAKAFTPFQLPPIATPTHGGGEGGPTRASATPTPMFAPPTFMGLHTNVLEYMTTEEYEAFQARVLGTPTGRARMSDSEYEAFKTRVVEQHLKP